MLFFESSWHAPALRVSGLILWNAILPHKALLTFLITFKFLFKYHTLSKASPDQSFNIAAPCFPCPLTPLFTHLSIQTLPLFDILAGLRKSLTFLFAFCLFSPLVFIIPQGRDFYLASHVICLALEHCLANNGPMIQIC